MKLNWVITTNFDLESIKEINNIDSNNSDLSGLELEQDMLLAYEKHINQKGYIFNEYVVFKLYK